MKLVVDSNVFITYFWKQSVLKKFLENTYIDFFAPDFALHELNEKKTIICKKCTISPKTFQELLCELAIHIDFVSKETYKNSLKIADKAIRDKKDIDFIALSHFLKITLWSNDKELKNQNLIPVFSTLDLLENAYLFVQDNE